MSFRYVGWKGEMTFEVLRTHSFRLPAPWKQGPAMSVGKINGCEKRNGRVVCPPKNVSIRFLDVLAIFKEIYRISGHHSLSI